MGVPVTVIDGQAVVGFDRVRLRELLSAAPKESAVHFGLKIADASSAAPKMGVSPSPGAIIGDVAPGLLGEKAGLKTNDIVTEISGRKVTSAADMQGVLSSLKSGDIVAILFLREGKTRKSEIIV
ncbi:MAG: PDZ domain-containing protein [Dehalococcoidales bacterium]|nr:PDZ domain-containing protein [Dehalococcoidales bacterium]